MGNSSNKIRHKLLERINRRRSWRWAKRGLLFLIFIAIFANFLANDKPYLCKYDNQWHAPVFKAVAVDLGISQWPPEQANKRWKEDKYQWELWPPIPYAPNQIDLYNNRYTSPFSSQKVKSWRHRHWLGTDDLGRDVMASMIWGTRIALIIGILSMLLAGIIGILLGSLAGYFGNHDLRLQRSWVLGGLFGSFLGLYWGFLVRRPLLDTDQEISYFAGGIFFVATASILGGWLAEKTFSSKKQVTVPIDSIVMRVIETINSIPGLLLLLSIVAIVPKPSIFSIITILGLLGWTGVARFVRGEMLQIRSLEYIQAAKVLGVSPMRSLWRHALPNALGPVYIALAFGISGAILIEAGLSFLGIGMPADTASWGKLLRFARSAPSAWWLAIFPGMAIFLTVTVFNLLGEAISEGENG